jgi:hypothetical protein
MRAGPWLPSRHNEVFAFGQPTIISMVVASYNRRNSMLPETRWHHRRHDHGLFVDLHLVARRAGPAPEGWALGYPAIGRG